MLSHSKRHLLTNGEPRSENASRYLASKNNADRMRLHLRGHFDDPPFDQFHPHIAEDVLRTRRSYSSTVYRHNRGLARFAVFMNHRLSAIAIIRRRGGKLSMIYPQDRAGDGITHDDSQADAGDDVA